MVHQHFMLVPVFTVAENVVLGVEPTTGLFGKLDTARRMPKFEKSPASTAFTLIQRR